MRAFLEITEWPDTQYNCNHVYWMDDAKNRAHAYAKCGNPAEVQTFRNPMTIDVRGRKFVEVRHDIYGWKDPSEPEPSANTWTVVGSKGDRYTVELNGTDYTCSCSGFKYRGSCRHVKEIQDAN